jgi:hypothetical protein
MGGALKIKLTRKEKTKSKENLPSTDLQYSKCHSKPLPFIFRRENIFQKQ